MRRILLILVFLSFEVFPFTLTQPIPEKATKNGYVEPFQMFDDLYYVGDKWVSSYLIKTSDGLVLIDSLESPFAQWIPDNVRKLGLNPQDIKYIFITHGHSDHVGGAEFLQSMYGSKVVISYEDFLLAKEQSKDSIGKGLFKAPEVQQFTGDGAELSIGDSKFKFYLTPGHTKGCLSIDFFVKDHGRKHRAFIVGGRVRGHPLAIVDLSDFPHWLFRKFSKSACPLLLFLKLAGRKACQVFGCPFVCLIYYLFLSEAQI